MLNEPAPAQSVDNNPQHYSKGKLQQRSPRSRMQSAGGSIHWHGAILTWRFDNF